MTDDEELIEQVARALFAADGVCSEHDWQNANEVARDHFRNQARAILPIIKAERIRGGEMVKEAFRSAFTELLTLYAFKVDGMPLEQARIHAETAAALRLRALSVPAIVEAGDGDL